MMLLYLIVELKLFYLQKGLFNMIGIIDYGFGNLGSVKNALTFLGFENEIFNDRKKIDNYDKLILPGVGAFSDAIKELRNKEFDKALSYKISDNTPILGICLGMQLLFDTSYENGIHKGLSFISGEIVKIDANVKVPHIGFNNLNYNKNSKIYKDLNENPYLYFVHSYHLETTEDVVNATTFYGKEIGVSVEKNNLLGVQYHPEKSGDVGLKILRNFCENY